MKFHSKKDAVKFCKRISLVGYITAGLGSIAMMIGASFGSDVGGFAAFLGALALSFGLPFGFVFGRIGDGINLALKTS